MSIPPESPEVGQCYLTEDGRVRKVMRLPAGWPHPLPVPRPAQQTMALRTLDHRSFVSTIERPVPCDWTPESDASSTGKSDQ
jgi:hypothetical protein